MKKKSEIIFEKFEKSDLPKRIIGIYFLIKKEKIVYIGKSVNCISRICFHREENVKNFDSYSLAVVLEKDIDYYEMLYIGKFKPKYNKVLYKEFQKN